MLSERGMQIVEKLVENNAKPVTSKVLALGLGVSERSVKTYIKEVFFKLYSKKAALISGCFLFLNYTFRATTVT